MARPSDYTQEVADAICNAIADGKSLRDICAADDMPDKATVFRWLGRHDDFRDQYARAREEQAEAFADEIVSIADEAELTAKQDGEEVRIALDATAVARNRLRIDARKWVASKLKPKKYGEKMQLDAVVTSRPAEELPDDELARIAAGSGSRATETP